MKKTTSKPAAKSPAPATKAASVAKAPVPVKKAVGAAKTAKPAAKKKTAAPAAPAASVVKPVATKPVVTTVTAQIDIGFGNALFLRGEGAGLSWDKGTLMTCINDNQWSLALGESARPIVFKFLVNDLSWSVGVDYAVAAGGSVTLVPSF